MSWLHSLEPLLMGLHYILCIFMIIVILLQAGKGADMGAAFGAGSSQTIFGARGAATFLSKMTTVVALMFLLTSISLASIAKNRLNPNNDQSAIDAVLSATDKQPANPEQPKLEAQQPEVKEAPQQPAPANP